MLETPNTAKYNIKSVRIWQMLQWTISRKPNYILYVRVGPSETTREARILFVRDNIVQVDFCLYSTVGVVDVDS